MEWAHNALSDEDELYIRYCLDRKPVWLNPDFLSEEEYRELECYVAEREGLLADTAPHITCHSDIRGGCFLTVSWPGQPTEMYRMEFPGNTFFLLWRVFDNGEEIPASALPVPYDHLYHCLQESRLPIAADQLPPPHPVIMKALQTSNKTGTSGSLPLLGNQYPTIYAALLHASYSGLLHCAEHEGHVTRNIIGKCLGLKTVTAGQMRALRKITAAPGDTTETVFHASRLLLTHWQDLPQSIRSLDELPASAIHDMFLDWEKWPLLKQCHWYAGWFQKSVFDSPVECLMYALLAMHLSGDSRILKRIKSEAQLVKLVFRALHQQLKNDPHLDETCEEREHPQLPGDPCYCIGTQIRFWLEDMDSSLSLICADPLGALLDEYTDTLAMCLTTPDFAKTIKHSGRLVHFDDLTLPASSLLAGYGFRQIRTHNEFTALAQEMRNCLGGRFLKAFCRGTEYWVFRPAGAAEPVVAEIYPDQESEAGSITVRQYLGPDNREPLPSEIKALEGWIALQSLP